MPAPYLLERARDDDQDAREGRGGGRREGGRGGRGEGREEKSRIRQEDERAAAPRSMAHKRKPFDWSTALVTLCVVVAAVVIYFRDGQARFVAVFSTTSGIFPRHPAQDGWRAVRSACSSTMLILSARGGGALGRRRDPASWDSSSRPLPASSCPGGPVTIYPVAGAFLAVGADVGAALAFVTS